MFDTKDEILEMFKTKSELKGKISTLLVGFYATNALNVPKLYGPQELPDGTYELALPMSGDMPIPMADLEADMGKWANALIEAPPGITLVGSTEQITWAEWLLLWAERNGVTARYRRTSPAEYSGRVEGISDAFAEEFQFVEQYGFVGGDPQVVYPNELRESGITIEESSIKNHITSCDWSSIL